MELNQKLFIEFNTKLANALYPIIEEAAPLRSILISLVRKIKSKQPLWNAV